MDTDRKECEILGNKCIVIGRLLPSSLDRSSEYDFRLMRLAPKGCDRDLLLERNRSKAQHVIFVFRKTFGSAITAIEVRDSQGGGWLDRDLATSIAKAFIRSVSLGFV